jgi:NAD(P)H-flavin reductase
MSSWEKFTALTTGNRQFLPGQWLDVYAPGVSKAGGFTIVSAPSAARPVPAATAAAAAPQRPGYLELAVQRSPDNPPAAYLWTEPASAILGAVLQVRVGGSFVWPPPLGDPAAIANLRRVVFVAGGVGINPLISMLAHLAENGIPGNPDIHVRFLYSTRNPGDGSDGRQGEEGGGAMAEHILFLDRLLRLLGEGDGRVRGALELYLTGGQQRDGVLHPRTSDSSEVPYKGRRMTIQDVEAALGDPAQRQDAVVYVCGVPDMTDEFVDKLTAPDGLGMERHRVLCEKWW